MVKFGEKYIFEIIRICSKNEPCAPIQRFCLESEKPTDYFYHIVGPTCFTFLIISLLGSVCLQILGNYFKLYQWSRNVFSCCPIMHSSFLQDSILNDNEQILQHFEEMVKNNHDVINKKDPLYGDTPLITAAKVNSFHILKKMVTFKVNFLIGNSNGETFLKILEMNLNESNHQEWKELLNIVRTNKIEAYSKVKVWNEQPMITAVRNNRFTSLCLFSILGGQWGTADIENISVLNFVLAKLEKENFDLIQSSPFVKWQIRQATNEYNQSLIILAAIHGDANCLKALIKIKANVNLRKKDNGRTPLHYSSRLENTDCTRLLIEHCADINATSFHNKTPLHDAALYGSANCAEMLIYNKAEVNARDNNGCTPLHFATKYASNDCLELLIKKGADVNAQNKFMETALSYLAFYSYVSEEEYVRGIEILIESGADLHLKDKDNRIPLDYRRVQELKLKKPELFERTLQ